MKVDTAEIEFLAKDFASKVIKKIEKNTKKLEKTTKKSSKNMSGAFKSLQRVIETGVGVSLGNLAGDALRKVIGMFKQGVVDALDFEQAMVALNQQVDNADDLMDKLRFSADGLIDDLILARSSARALAFGLDEEAIPALLETAVALGKIQGLNPDQAFNDIVVGIARASPQILDNLGIVLDAELTYRKYAESIETTAAELAKSQKLIALQNHTIENSRLIVLKAAFATKTLKEEWQEFSASQRNWFRDVASGIGDWWVEQNKRSARESEIMREAIELSISNNEVLKKKFAILGFGNTEQDAFNKLLEETMQSERAYEDILRGTNDALTENYKQYQKLGKALKDYKTDLEGAQAALKNLVTEQTQEQVDIDREVLQLKKDQLIQEQAINEAVRRRPTTAAEAIAITEGRMPDTLTPSQVSEANKLLDEYNSKYGTNVKLNEDINLLLDARIAKLRTESELIDVSKSLEVLTREKELQDKIAELKLRNMFTDKEEIETLEAELSGLQESLGLEADRAKTFQDFQERFDKYVNRTLPGLRREIKDVSSKIDLLKMESNKVVKEFEKMTSNMYLTGIYAERLRRTLSIIRGGTKIDIETTEPPEELIDTGN